MITAAEALSQYNGTLLKAENYLKTHIELDIKAVMERQRYIEIELNNRYYSGDSFIFEGDKDGTRHDVALTKEVLKQIKKHGYSTKIEIVKHGDEYRDGKSILTISWAKK